MNIVVQFPNFDYNNAKFLPQKNCLKKKKKSDLDINSFLKRWFFFLIFLYVWRWRTIHRWPPFFKKRKEKKNSVT